MSINDITVQRPSRPARRMSLHRTAVSRLPRNDRLSVIGVPSKLGLLPRTSCYGLSTSSNSR
jgi:hypothetical protein